MDENIKVSQLPSADTITDNDLFMIVQNNENKKATARQLGSYNLDNYYTKSETDDLLDEKADISDIPSNDNLVNVGTSVDTDYKVNVLTTKNLFDKDNAKILSAYFDNNVPITSDNRTRTIYIPCKENTTYTISKAQSNRFRVGYTTELPTTNTSVLGVISNNTATSITITTGNNATYIVAFVWINSDTLTLNQVLDSIQIEEGSTPTTYEAFIPNTINVNNEKYTDTINVGTSINDKNRINVLYSKNLFDKSTIIEGKYIDASGNFVNDSNNFIGDIISIDNTKTYYLNASTSNAKRIAYYDSSQTFISREVFTLLGSTLTIPNNAKYLRLSCYNQDLNTLQLELGNQATTYEPYIVPSINVDGEEIYNANVMNYSTNEQRIGTWIDGKPLYRKYIRINGLPNSASKTVATGISNLDFIQIDYGNSYCSWGTPRLYPIIRPTLEVVIDSSKQVAITTTQSYGDSWFMYILVQYTKTTD